MDLSKNEEQLSKAQKVVYRFLKFRLRSEYELRDKLRQRKLPASIVKQTIMHFKAIGLVNDIQFALQWTSLSEWAGSRLDARHVSILGMSGGR